MNRGVSARATTRRTLVCSGGSASSSRLGGRPRFLLGKVAQPGAGPGAERLVITEHGLDLGEARHRPDPVALQVDDGAGVPQLPVGSVRGTEELLIERVDVQHGRLGHRLRLPGLAAVPVMT